MEAIADNHTMLHGLGVQPERIQPSGVQYRRDFINNNPKMLLFRVRGVIGIATHFMLLTDWQNLNFKQLVAIRRAYEQVCY